MQKPETSKRITRL